MQKAGASKVLSVEYLTRVGLLDALSGLRDNANAIGWYDEKVSKALKIVPLIHPEIATDPQAKFAFIWGLAVTSKGLKVNKNFELAEQVYRVFMESSKDPSQRRMPTKMQAGTTQKAINKSPGIFNTLRTEWGGMA